MLFHNAKELLALCEEKNCKISQIALEQDLEDMEISEAELLEKVGIILDTMLSSSEEATTKEVRSISKMSGGYAKLAMDYAKEGDPICGKDLMRAMAYAFSTSEVNASMGRIVAAPTAGSSGILPAVIRTLHEKEGLDREALKRILFTASAIGQIVEVNATVSGAEGGCQAECGTAAAMGAAAVVEALGGTPKQSTEAASFAFMNIMGLVCDPIGGFVEFPCSLRNASGIMNALSCADLAMAGIESLVPFDEVVDAMARVGRALPESLRETGKGGVAITSTGLALKKEYLDHELE